MRSMPLDGMGTPEMHPGECYYLVKKTTNSNRKKTKTKTKRTGKKEKLKMRLSHQTYA